MYISYPYEDLQAAPGAQNDQPHSCTGTNEVHFWDEGNPQATVYALRVLVEQIYTKPNVVGVELLNEPTTDKRLFGWYENTIAKLRGAIPDQDFPLYVSDAWDPSSYVEWIGKRDDFVVMDHHLHRFFRPAEHKLNGDQHADAMRNETLGKLSEWAKKSGGRFIVGEWAAALHPASLGDASLEEKDRQRRVFAQAQIETYDKTAAGYFWWTYKKGTAGWSAQDSVAAGLIPDWRGRKRAEVKKIESAEMTTAFRDAFGM